MSRMKGELQPTESHSPTFDSLSLCCPVLSYPLLCCANISCRVDNAEGLLALADALVEASSESPDLIIDCATLTGIWGRYRRDEGGYQRQGLRGWRRRWRNSRFGCQEEISQTCDWILDPFVSLEYAYILHFVESLDGILFSVVRSFCFRLDCEEARFFFSRCAFF